MPTKKINYSILCISMVWGLCCSKDESFDQNQLLQDITHNFIIPQFKQLDSLNAVLENSTLAFTENPSLATLNNLQQRWLSAMQCWSTLEMLHFGPATDSYRYLQIDNTPANTGSIENSLVDTVFIDSLYIAQRSSYTKGFASTEYLIFGSGNNTMQDIVANYSTNNHHERRAAYLLNCAKNIHTVSSQLVFEWIPDGNNYAAQAIDSDGLTNLCNSIIHLSQTVARKKIGKPLGKESSGQQVLPGLEESKYAHASWDIILYNIKGIKEVFGDREKGLGSLLSFNINDPTITDSIASLIRQIEQSVQARNLSFDIDIMTNTTDVEAIYQTVKALYELLSFNIAAYLPVTVFPNPDDGD